MDRNVNVIWWTSDDVQRWLRDIGVDEKFADFFSEQNIDGEGLLLLETQHLLWMVKVFDQIFDINGVLKFEKHLKRLKGDDSSSFGDGVLSFPRFDTPPADTTAPASSNEADWQKDNFEECVRIMETSYPDDCWRYKSTEAILKDYMSPKDVGGTDVGEQLLASTAVHVVSPVDFCVQPAFVQSAIRKMHWDLNEAYSDDVAAIPSENICVGMPCVVRSKQDSYWYRAEVADVVGIDEAPVRFVDLGYRQFSPLNDLKPLRAEFGRIPPAAVRCRIKGVRERTLEQKVLDAFHEELNSLGCEIAMKIIDSTPDAFLVEIFNRYTNENIGTKYLPKEPICPKMPSLKAWNAKKMQQQRERESSAAAAAVESVGAATADGDGGRAIYSCDMDALIEGAFLDGDFSSDDDGGQTGEIKRMNKKLRRIKHQETLEAQKKAKSIVEPKHEERNRVAKLLADDKNDDRTFQRRFRKQRKPLCGTVDVRVTHVESTHEIYVQILALEDGLANIQDAMAEIYDGDQKKAADDSTVLRLPEESVAVGNACAVYDPKDAAWYRCRIAEVNSDRSSSIIVQAVDVGKRLAVTASDGGLMKVLLCTDQLDGPPKAFRCRIDRLCEHAPTPTETDVLREVLPIGSVMTAEFDRGHVPWRVKLFFVQENDDKNFSDYFQEELTRRGLAEKVELERRPCTDLVLWRIPTNVIQEAADLSARRPRRSRTASVRGRVEVAGTKQEKRENSGDAKKLQNDDVEEKAVLSSTTSVKTDTTGNSDSKSVTEGTTSPAAPYRRYSAAAGYNPDLTRKPIRENRTVSHCGSSMYKEWAKESNRVVMPAVDTTSGSKNPQPRAPVQASALLQAVLAERARREK